MLGDAQVSAKLDKPVSVSITEWSDTIYPPILFALLFFFDDLFLLGWGDGAPR